MGILLEITAPIFVLIFFGFLSLKLKFFNPTTINGLMKFVTNIAIPVLLFNSVAKMDLGVGFNSGLLLSFYTGSFISFIFALFLSLKVFQRSREESVVIAFTALFGNTVLLGLAVIDRAFGEESLAGTYTIVVFHAPFCFLVGITTMEAFRGKHRLKGVILFSVLNEIRKNAIIIGMGIGFLFNLLNFSLPTFFQVPVSMISESAIPSALFGLGGILAQYKPEGDIKLILVVCIITLIFHPLWVWIFSTQIFMLPKELIQSGVLTAAMPPGLNAFIFASIYQKGRKIAASSALCGTIFSIATASLAIYLVG